MISILQQIDNGIIYVLENGDRLTPDEWSIDHFEVDNKKYYPVFETNKNNQFELNVIGFETTKFNANRYSNYENFKG